MTYSYIPPAFELYEFDDEPLGTRRYVCRGFNGWNGPVNSPAQEVSLAWSSPDSAVLVSTTGQADDARWARLSAAHLALGGTTLPIPARPGSTGEVQEEIQRIAESTELWSPLHPIMTGGTSAAVAVLSGFLLACTQAGSGHVLVAATGVRIDQLRVRKVRDWGAYDIDATQSHPLSDLSR